jgi:endonuclease I
MIRTALLTILSALAAGCPSSFSVRDVTAERPEDRDATTDRPQPREALPPDLLRWPDLPADRPLREIETLTDQAMKTALYNLVKGQSGLSYTKAKSAMFVVAQGGIDVHNGVVECIYTGRTTVADGTTSPGGFNVEHSWPQSEGADTAPAEGDLHHLFPVESNANSHRSSLPFGNTDCGAAGAAACKWQDGGSKIGVAASGIGTVFQVRPERRGEIARAHFYFSIRYQMAIPPDEEQTLRGWNALDPPDDLERGRNTAIIAIQKKGNPFIDRPDFVQHIADF